MSQANSPKGIGGWLLLLIVGLCVLHPAVGAWAGVNNVRLLESSALRNDPSWPAFWFASWLLFSLVSALRVLAGALLAVRREVWVPRIALAVIFVAPLASWTGNLLLGRLFMAAPPLAQAAAQSLLPLASGLGWAAVWMDRPAFRRHPDAIIDGNDRGVYGQQQAVHG